MRIAVPNEISSLETRVALVPESIKKLVAAGMEVAVEHGAGEKARISDEAFQAAGASVQADRAALLASADLIARVGPPDVAARKSDVGAMKVGCILLTSLMPQRNLEAVRKLAERGITAISTDAIPRITRAQSMDTLSSMASISGYLGVLHAAMLMGRYVPMLTTAAGTLVPAKFFVIGAGVAGLQAIATAKRLGAIITATDVRPEVKEQIESVGARFVGISLAQDASAGGGYARELSAEDQQRQRQLIADQCAQADVVVTTALIGGVFAPRLITADMVNRMKPGAVIIDLAAEGGGNCELSKPGSTVESNGVAIAAPLNLPAQMPVHASLLWSRNLTNFILAFWKDKAFNLDLNDEILKGAVITHDGDVVHAKTKQMVETPAA